MTAKIRAIERFFEEDISNAIPAIVKEYANLLGDLTYEEEIQLLHNSRLKILSQTDHESIYMFMYEPYTRAVISEDVLEITIADQMNTILKFTTTNIEQFMHFWNTNIVSYYGQQIHLPEMHI